MRAGPPAAWRGGRGVQGRAAAGRERRAKAAQRRVHPAGDRSGAALRAHRGGLPSIDNPDFVSQLVFDTRAGEVGVPKSRFAYLFPSKNSALVQVRLRPELTDEERERAIDLIREAVAQPAFKPKEGGRYVVTGVPVVTAGPLRRGAALDLRAAGSRAAGDGGHARTGLPHPAALAAAGARAGGGGHDLRRPVAHRRQPDHGLDRRAAGADRAGRGLRDPVPGALRRGARPLPRGRSRRSRGPGGRGGRAHDRHGRPRHRGRLRGAAALAGPDGARIRRPAGARHRARAAVHAHGRLRGADTLRVAPGAGHERAAAAVCPPARARGRASLSPAHGAGARGARRPRLAGARLLAHPPTARARHRAPGGGDRAGARHPERGGVGRARARSARPAGAARTSRSSRTRPASRARST